MQEIAAKPRRISWGTCDQEYRLACLCSVMWVVFIDGDLECDKVTFNAAVKSSNSDSKEIGPER